MTATSKPENFKHKVKAKALYLQGHTAKEISAVTGVSEKSLGKWIKLYKWKEAQVKLLSDTSDVNGIKDFVTYLKGRLPLLDKELTKAYNDYLQIK